MAVSALSKMGVKPLDPLIKALSDKKPILRQWATIPLGKMEAKAEKAVPSLLKLLADDQEKEMVRSCAGISLCKIKPDGKEVRRFFNS